MGRVEHSTCHQFKMAPIEIQFTCVALHLINFYFNFHYTQQSLLLFTLFLCPFPLGIHLGFLSCSSCFFLFFQYACTFLFDKASRPQLFVNFQGPTLAFTYLIWHSQWTMLCVCECVCVWERACQMQWTNTTWRCVRVCVDYYLFPRLIY